MARSVAEVVAAHIEAGKTKLPLFDRTAARLQSMLRDREFDIKEAETLISSDPVLTSTLLRLANSSFFGGLEKVVNVQDAIVRLGVKQVSNLVTLIAQKKIYQLKTPQFALMVRELWRHAVACAAGAYWLAGKIKRPELEDEAFLAGLLHDIGKLFVLRVLDDLCSSSTRHFEPSEALVHELLNSLHAEQGHALMRKWNFPDVYAEIARRHHDEDFEEDEALLLVVRLADQACNRLGIGIRPQPGLVLAATAEAQFLRVSDVVVAELEIKLEDAMELVGL